MTVRVLWHGRVVGTLGADTPAEIARRCSLEDIATMEEEVEARIVRDNTLEDLAYALSRERFMDWSIEDLFVPNVEEALYALMEDPRGECDGFAFGLPEGRIVWWSAVGDLPPAESAKDLARAMVCADRTAAAHFAVSRYLRRLHASDAGDAYWEQDLAQGLAAGDEYLLASRVTDVLEEHWDGLMEEGLLAGTVHAAGSLSVIETLPQTPSDDTEAI